MTNPYLINVVQNFALKEKLTVKRVSLKKDIMIGVKKSATIRNLKNYEEFNKAMLSCDEGECNKFCTVEKINCKSSVMQPSFYDWV